TLYLTNPTPPTPTLFPYTTLFRSNTGCAAETLAIPIWISSISPAINKQTFILNELLATTTIADLKQYFQAAFEIPVEEQYIIFRSEERRVGKESRSRCIWYT